MASTIKITKTQLKQIIKEELKDIFSAPPIGRKTKAILLQIKDLIPAEKLADEKALDKLLSDVNKDINPSPLQDLLSDLFDAGEIGVEDISHYINKI